MKAFFRRKENLVLLEFFLKIVADFLEQIAPVLEGSTPKSQQQDKVCEGVFLEKISDPCSEAQSAGLQGFPLSVG